MKRQKYYLSTRSVSIQRLITETGLNSSFDRQLIRKLLNSNYYVNQTQNQPSENLNDHPAEYNTDILSSTISSEEIGKMIDKSSNSKAASPQNFILKEYIKITKKLLCYLYTPFFLTTFLILAFYLMHDSWVQLNRSI